MLWIKISSLHAVLIYRVGLNRPINLFATRMFVHRNLISMREPGNFARSRFFSLVSRKKKYYTRKFMEKYINKQKRANRKRKEGFQKKKKKERMRCFTRFINESLPNRRRSNYIAVSPLTFEPGLKRSFTFIGM